MSKRRGVLKDILGKAVYGEKEEYLITYLDRSLEHGSRELKISSSRVIAVSNWAITLDDNETVIPLHRILEIREKNGKILWRKGEKYELHDKRN
ncbi:MAG: DUF504 domain-containing protein [Caldisphaera sp.]|jgi:uncharacterized protein (UPF0248 family)|nr:MAG: DUF504 domain-containing protein [Caldisphaera sp.]PMP89481.1 MAG: DUF504 domain-containing protein [Caldisphaera sp.]